MSIQMHESTCWTVIRDAAEGDPSQRDRFAHIYEPIIRDLLAVRWRSGPLTAEIDDAVQEVFVECFRSGGALDRAEPSYAGGFRQFLHGVIRNVARRAEARYVRRRPADLDPDALPADDESLSLAFDRAWARAILGEAARLQAIRATGAGSAALRRVELLRLRFQSELPPREIARLWNVDASEVYREYDIARDEFRDCLRTVVAFHHPVSPAEIDIACMELISLLH